MCTIKTFCTDDTDSVRQLWAECLVVDQPWNAPEQAIRRQQACQPAGFFVGRIEGRVISTCIAGYDGVRGWLYRVVVSPRHRGQGHGRKIVEHAEQYLKQLGCVRINLQVLGTNQAAVEFWQTNDYVIQDRVSMAKVLAMPDSGSAEQSAPDQIFRSRTDVLEFPLKGRPATTREPDPTPEFEICLGFRLTRFQSTDKPQLHRILSESEVYSRYTSLPFPYLESDAEEWVAKWSSPTPQMLQTERVWGIRDRDTLLIGVIGLHSIQPAHDAEIGYWLTTEHWGHGIATRAVGRLCKFAFDELRLIHMTAKVITENTASIRVLEKNDFQHEGTLRRAHKQGDQQSDVLVYGRLGSDVA